MLKLLRSKNVTKVILWAILILILPAFVLWGTGNLGRSEKKGPAYVGTIGGKRVSFDDFAQSMASVRCQIVLNYFNDSKSLESLLKNKAFMGKLSWDRLILINKARVAGIKVSDKDVIGFITSHRLFLRNGAFDDRVYEYFLKNSLGMYPRNFEELIRENLMVQRLTDTVSKDVKVTDEELRRNYERDNSKFKISYIFIPLTNFADKIKVSEEDVKSVYELNKDAFVFHTKTDEGKEGPSKPASFDEAKEAIRSILFENKVRPLALESANKTYENLRESMAKNKLPFEPAAMKLGLKTQETLAFIKSDYLEDIGEADPVAALATKMKPGEISKPLEMKKGDLIFKLIEIQPFNEETFKKEKADYAKKALTDKKNTYTDEWLKEVEKSAKLNIDLKDYDKYYK